MKRPSPDTPTRPRRQRDLTDAERQLWESVAAQAKPLRKRSRPTGASVALRETSGITTASASAQRPTAPDVAKGKKTKAPPPGSITRRERSQLSRGRKDIDARIDLHGMTQTRAHRALLRFLQNASGDGLTFVLVITGKGRAADPDSGRGVLRRQVPQWLALPEFRSLVVGFDEAHVGHGGEGALYVRLRRARSFRA
jgi:DNA-nicking Smr family endonuclease